VNTDDPADAVADLHYTVEAGSGRRKNKQTQIDNFNMLSQSVFPTLQTFAAGGITGPWNNFMDIIEDTFETPMSRLKLPENMPPQEGEGGGEGGGQGGGA